MTEQPYEVDLDLGDDPQASEVAQRERVIDPDFGILGYNFEDDDSKGRLGINDGVRAERLGVIPHQRWGGDRSAEEEALSVVPDPDAVNDRPPEGDEG
ncbi:hypothetical protein GCM10007079_26340 [Nocardiopsis terrae]|uniref:DUF5709 domain-containing protein n=1 Tax=Nocardiopsis terrae TaxID=372655 RepID=A0ABR9HFE6_9ACTN|nr:hypothetical protein [Nocardiopsis terrae]MBE1457763.1 hypothetical protein [Nocardiopsis terrae]GHC84415.1 hypothetical protein GCM10007079_26340 [Nocardiopsis terrae]